MKIFWKKYWKFFLGLLIVVAFLGYFIKLIEWKQVYYELRNPAHPWLIVLGTLVGSLNFAIRAVRWKYLLLPLKPIRVHSLFSAVCIGFMAITLIPGRVGEFIRAYVLARREQMRTSPVFATVVVERVLDGITLIAGLSVSLFFFRGRDGVSSEGGETLSRVEQYSSFAFAALLVVLALIFLVIYKPRLAPRLTGAVFFFLPERWRTKLVDIATSFTEGFSVLSKPRLLFPLTVYSLLCWACIGLGMWLILLGFDIRIPLSQIFIIVVLTAGGVSVPTPAGMGGYHGAFIAGLVLIFAVDQSKATAAVIVCHILAFLPVTLLGAGYAWKEGLSLGAMKTIAGEEAVDPPGMPLEENR